MSNIEWTDESFQTQTGCSRVSPGCGGARGVGGCYAEVMAKRLVAMGAYPADVIRPGGGWSGKVTPRPDWLAKPLSWRKPRRIFVNSMSDTFHESVPNEYIAALFGVMAACPQHTFQVLTKRPERMADWFAWLGTRTVPKSSASGPRLAMAWEAHRAGAPLPEVYVNEPGWQRTADGPWPLPNVWIGTSVESQAAADERIPHLLRCPAAVRFVSAEPLLGPVDLSRWLRPQAAFFAVMDTVCGNILGRPVGPTTPPLPDPSGLSWIIVGGESGPGARPCDVAWLRSIVRQCREAGTACFVKQLGAVPFETFAPGCDRFLTLRDRKGGDPSEWPEDLRVREFPGGAP